MSIGLLRLSRYATRLKNLKPRKNKSASSLRQLRKACFCSREMDISHARRFVAFEEKILVFSGIDNLAKGASSQAIQNMNIIFGLDEILGLK